jgi:hypothetical protein
MMDSMWLEKVPIMKHRPAKTAWTKKKMHTVIIETKRERKSLAVSNNDVNCKNIERSSIS